jgi:hypothetical protein
VTVPNGPMKKVTGTVISSRPLQTEWEEGECLCAGKFPESKRIDVLNRIFDEKRQKWRWKSQMRFNQDCPIHGIGSSEECHEA